VTGVSLTATTEGGKPHPVPTISNVRSILRALRNLARRKLELCVPQCGANAIRRLLDFGLGQSREVKSGEAAAQVHFDRDERRIEPGKATRENDGERHAAGPRE
jgi:hypothetical protein